MADFINWNNLVYKNSNQNYDNPGSDGTSYYFYLPCGNFQVATGERSSIFQSQPHITFSIWYYNGNGWTNVKNGYVINENTTYTLWHNQVRDTSTTPYDIVNGDHHLFRLDAIRTQGEGDRTHVYFHPESLHKMAEETYNTYFKGRKMYGVATQIPYLVSGRGDVPLETLLAYYNLTDRQGQKITTANAAYLTTEY